MLAGYFSKFVLMLINKRPHQIVPYLYDSESDVIDRLLDHMYNTSVCDILIKIFVAITPRYDKEMNQVIYDKDFEILKKMVKVLKAETRPRADRLLVCRTL